jgi:UDP-GlcNAc:undecaprenyl-phosphate/decaprenyl-phosphate GlcNAc-1-phosphate transferase
MTTFWLWAGAGVLALLIARRLGADVARGAALTRRNYRGLQIPSGLGIAVLVAFVAGIGLVAFVHAVARHTPTPAAAARANLIFLAAALGFGLWGLWDDVASGPERGLRAHIATLRSRRPSSGAVKLVAGAALGFAIASPFEGSFWRTLADGALIALFANLLNLLDVRPGRAGKAFILAAVPMMAIGGPTGPALASALGATVGVLPLELDERAMLGDVGANGLGAVAGLAVVALGSGLVRLLVLAMLILLHLLAEGPTLSRLIAAVPPLSALDRLGRVPE